MKKVLLSALALSAVAASQAVIVISEDFDQAQYVVGSNFVDNGTFLTSQPSIDWTSTAANTTSWKINNNQFVSAGKSVHVTGTSGTWTWPGGTPTVSAGEIWIASVKVRVDSTAPAANRSGLDVWGATNLGGLAIRSDGTVATSTTGTWSTVAGLSAANNTWHEIKLVMTYTTATTGTMQRFLNGTAVGAATALGSAFTDADLYASTGGATSRNSNFDDYKLEVVPEPATMAALGLGLAAMARRRKSK